MYLTILAAYLGGILSLMTPCSGLVIPTFAAAVVKRQFHPLLIIGLFSLGMLLVLAPLAVGATAMGQFLLLYRRPLTLGIGLVFLGMGGSLVLGKQFRLPDIGGRLAGKAYTGPAGLIVLGMISALGASACVGPILGAIISLASAQGNSLDVYGLILAYGAGIITPLLVFSFGLSMIRYHKIHQGFSQERTLGKYKISLSDFFNGLLLILIGYIFLIHQGSLSSISIGGAEFNNYIFDLQESLFRY